MVGTYRQAVFVVIYKKDKGKIFYLILKRKKHWKGWEFPKGGIEKNESLERTVEREAFEETGLKPFNIRKFDVAGEYRYKKVLKDRGGIIGQTYVLFSAEVSGWDVKIDKREHSEFSWIEFEGAKKILTHQNQKDCLEIVNNSLKTKTS